MKFRYEILLVFIVLEVLLFGKPSIWQFIVSLIEYCFIILALLMNRKIGIMYFISFTLLAMGAWSYVSQPELPLNFWGIRVAGLSLNILLSFAMVIYCLVAQKLPQKIHTHFYNNGFFVGFILYTFFVGIVYVISQINYFDNFLSDVLLYFPFFIYIFFLSFLDTRSILKIVEYGVSLTVISMVVSLLSNKLFDYSGDDGFSFVLMNGFSYMAIFALFFFKDLYSKFHYYFLVCLLLVLLLAGKVFIGGKMLIIIFIAVIWLAYHYKRAQLIILISAATFLIFINPILFYFSENYSDSLLITYKFTQVYNLFEHIDLDVIASTPTSVGNIVAEAVTIFYYLENNKFFLFFGKGMGGGIADILGYLTPSAGPGMGYNLTNTTRNDFFRMHLPMYDILIKSGVVGFSIYIILLIKWFKKNNIFSFVSFILMFTVFNNTKESILLTLIFIRLSGDFLSLKGLTLNSFLLLNNYTFLRIKEFRRASC